MLNIFFSRKPSTGDVTLETFFKLCEIVSKSNPKLISLAALPTSDQLTEALRQIAELLIWAEQDEQPGFFEMFCERNVLPNMVYLFTADWPSVSVKVQILQTLSLLTTNLNDPTSIYYLFSKNWFNQIITTGGGFISLEDDLLSNYVNLCKSLALLLNKETVNFFVGDSGFPLFTQLTRFFDNPDPMVRAAVRTGTLLILRLLSDDASPVLNDSQGYFTLVACRLRDAWLSLGDSKAAEDVTDLLMYISDILSVKNSQLSELLEDKIIDYVLKPCIFPAFENSGKLPIPLAILALAQILFFLKHSKCEKYIIEHVSIFRESVKLTLQAADADAAFAAILIHELAGGEDTRSFFLAMSDSLHATESLEVLKIKLAILQFWASEISPRKSGFSSQKKSRAETAAAESLIAAAENEKFIPAFEEILLQEKMPEILHAEKMVAEILSEPWQLIKQSSLVSHPSIAVTPKDQLVRWILLRRQNLPEEQDKVVSQIFNQVILDMTGSVEDSQWKEEATVDVADLAQLQCSVKLVDLIGYQQELTTQMYLHPNLLVVGIPEGAKAVVKIQRRIRSISASIDKERSTTLLVKTEEGKILRLDFEDEKKSHLALIHLETRKITNRAELVAKIIKNILE